MSRLRKINEEKKNAPTDRQTHGTAAKNCQGREQRVRQIFRDYVSARTTSLRIIILVWKVFSSIVFVNLMSLAVFFPFFQGAQTAVVPIKSTMPQGPHVNRGANRASGGPCPPQLLWGPLCPRNTIFYVLDFFQNH